MASPNPTGAASEPQTDATNKTSSSPTNERAPAPKGGAGDKPTINASPVPKGQKGAKPTVEHGGTPAPKQPPVQNPTYGHASQFVNQYFRREAELSDLF